jgi:hypothetical protein
VFLQVAFFLLQCFSGNVVLKVPGRVIAVYPADVDADGQNDVFVFWRQQEKDGSKGRVSLYRTVNGKVQPTPTQVLNVPDQTVAFDVGDVNMDSRADVILLAADGVWSLAGLPGGRLSERPQSLVKVMTLAAFPHEDHVPPMKLLLRLNSGLALMIPTVPIGPYAIYQFDKLHGYQLQSVLKVPTRSNLFTVAEDFRSIRGYSASFSFSFPRWEQGDHNGDGRMDLFFFSRERVSVFWSREGGGFGSQPDVQRRFKLLTQKERRGSGTHLRGATADFDGDGRSDLFFNKTVGGIANMKNQITIFLATPAGFGDSSVFTINSKGYGASVRAEDVDADGRIDIIRPSVEMGLMAMTQVLIRGKLDVDFLVHLNKKKLPEIQAVSVIESTFKIDFNSNQELSGPYPLFGEDFNQDKKPDVLLGLAGGGSGKYRDRIVLLLGQGHGVFDPSPAWSLSLPSTRFIKAFRISPKSPPGLLIYFSRSKKHCGDVWVLTP